MNEDAEFCFGVPLRRGPLVHGVPGRFVGLRVQRTQQQGEEEKVFHSQPFFAMVLQTVAEAIEFNSSVQKAEYIFPKALESTLK
jgi:hypothetical protein